MQSADRHAYDLDPSSFPWDGGPRERARFLVRYAVLAPSSHNSQPWRFHLDDAGVDVFLDPDRWLRVADADQRELYVSVGCAIENLCVAASAFGYEPLVEYLPDATCPTFLARIRLVRPEHGGLVGDRALFDAILTRHTCREPFEETPPSAEATQAIVEAGCERDVRLALFDDATLRSTLDRLTVRADAEQFASPAFREELGRYIGDGAFGQGWLVAKLGKLAVTHLDVVGSTQARDSKMLLHTPVYGFVVSDGSEPATRVRAGRALERAWLRAESLGLRLHPMNQVLQVESVRRELREVAPLGGAEPQIVFRLGVGPRAAKTPRRPIDEVIEASA